jgi:hypothetical protein
VTRDGEVSHRGCGNTKRDGKKEQQLLCSLSWPRRCRVCNRHRSLYDNRSTTHRHRQIKKMTSLFSFRKATTTKQMQEKRITSPGVEFPVDPSDRLLRESRLRSGFTGDKLQTRNAISSLKHRPDCKCEHLRGGSYRGSHITEPGTVHAHLDHPDVLLMLHQLLNVGILP